MFLWLGFQDLPDGYVCACPRGFSGPQCGTGGPLTCADEPCFNRGVCVTAAAGGAGSGSYTCRCPPGYAGSNCEMKANRCSGHPCANGNEPDRAQARLTLALRVVVVAGREKKGLAGGPTSLVGVRHNTSARVCVPAGPIAFLRGCVLLPSPVRVELSANSIYPNPRRKRLQCS